MFIVFPVPHSTLTCLLISLSYSSSSNIYYIHPYIFLHFLLLLATNNNSSSFSIYTFPFFNTRSLTICHLFPCNILTLAFFISSTTLTISLSLFLAIFIFSNIFTSGPSITTSTKLQIYYSLIKVWLLLSFSTSTF